MNNHSRYFIGIIIGMLGEYLYRVEFNFLILFILLTNVLILLIDLLKK